MTSTRHTKRHAVANLSRVLLPVGLNTILGRLLLSASLLIVTVLMVAWWSHAKVENANVNNTVQLSKRVKLSHQTNRISNTLWQIETDFQAFMLIPDEKLREQINILSQSLIEDTLELKQAVWINSSDEIQLTTQSFHEQAIALHQGLREVITIRTDPLKLYPTLPIMVNELNPLHSEFINIISMALKESNTAKFTPQNMTIRETFNELRYAWMSKITYFRMLAATRVGLFRYSVESSIADSVYNISLYDKQVEELLKKLQSYNERDLLGFEQSLSVNNLKELNSLWNENYEHVKSILTQDDGWRRDTPIIQNTVNPLFTGLWENLRALEKEAETRAMNDIHSTSMTADQVSYTLWVLALIIIVATLSATLLFEAQVRRPIARVVRALKAEAEGQLEINLPSTSIVETRDLVSAFTEMRKKVHNRQEHLQAVLTYAADAIITTSYDGTIESFNPAAEFLFHIKESDILGKTITSILPEFNTLSFQADGSEIESFARDANGEVFPIGINISRMRVGEQNLHLVMLADIRERKAMLDGIQAREQRLRSILDNTAEGIVTFDAECRIESWNQAAERLFGLKEADVYGAKFNQFIFSETDAALFEGEHINLTGMIGKDIELIGRHRNGSHFPISLKVSQMSQDGKTKYTALIANISERKAMMENLRYLAEHDSLTHLHNRAYFNVELDNIVQQIKSNNGKYALFYIDLDNFKYINDTLGHAAGDKLLIEVATMLKRRARGSDVVARLGGDEFVVIIADVNQETIHNIADSYRNTLAEYDFHYDGHTVDVGCSIGVSIIDSTASSPSDVLAQADVACHLAKRAGRNRVHMFSNRDAGDVQTMSIDMGWSRRIRQALEKDRFVLAVQPIYKVTRRDIFCYEVLVRMRDDDDSIIMPSGFLPTADRFGLSVHIDAWVIEHAMQYMAKLNQHGQKVCFAINLSGQSITAPHIAALIPRLISETGIDPTALIFEVTETTAISNIDIAIALLTKLREMGCKTALDDFGSGMSSFAYLQELPVDIVKIDGRFVRNISSSTVDQAMVRAMNEIAHALDKCTVAEFVENEHHFKSLLSIGVDYAQGYHLGKPQLLDEVAEKLLVTDPQQTKSA